MPKVTKITLKKEQLDLLEILEKNAGLIQQSCKKANLSRQTFYKWKKENPLFAEKAEDIEEGLLDFTEGKLLENIKSGSESSIFFYLKCKGKKRGYVERQEVEHSGKVDTEITVTIDGLKIED